MSATTPDQQSLQSFKIVMEGNRGMIPGQRLNSGQYDNITIAIIF